MLLSALALAVSSATAGAAPARPLLLAGATVHTVSGETLSPGQVLMREGRIAAVGTNVTGEGAELVDLSGQHLYPGLIALDTVLGLTEISGVRATLDSTEVGDFTPDVESWIAVNPDSELVPAARANGIAFFEPVPLGGIVAGQSGLVAVDGWTTEQRTIKAPLALHLFWPNQELALAPRGRGGRGGGQAKSLDEQAKARRARVQATIDFFDEARAYAKAKDAAAKGKATAPERIPAWEAMLPYVKGELPITVHAEELRQIQAALHWAATNDYKIVIAGGRDAWRAAALLADQRVPVIYRHVFRQPARDTEGYDVNFRAPELLRQAGVKVVFSMGPEAFDAPLTRDLPYTAARAAAFGLPEAEALKGLTLYPAQVAGVADRLGSLEPGKEATLFAADGNILDIRTQVKRMWLAGREVSLETRHTRLYEKYRNRPRPGP